MEAWIGAAEIASNYDMTMGQLPDPGTIARVPVACMCCCIIGLDSVVNAIALLQAVSTYFLVREL